MKGARVAVVESASSVVSCLNRGCIPSKSLIASAAHYQHMKHAGDFGIDLATPPVYNWPNMLARKDKMVGGLVGGKSRPALQVAMVSTTTRDSAGSLEKRADRRRLRRQRDQTQGREYHHRYRLPLAQSPELSDRWPARILTSDHLLTLEHLPKSMLIVGAGAIGCEWAFMLSMLEVEVHDGGNARSCSADGGRGCSTLIERELKSSRSNFSPRPKSNRLRRVEGESRRHQRSEDRGQPGAGRSGPGLQYRRHWARGNRREAR